MSNDRIIEVKDQQVWVERRTGRRLRVVAIALTRTSKVGVRNCETGRLSYLPQSRFQDGSLTLEPEAARR